MSYNRQQTMNGQSTSGEGWTGLINSMIRLTNAATIFSIQQMQNGMEMFRDSRGVLHRMTHSIDSISNAMTGEMSDSNKSSVDQMNRMGMAAVSATTGGSEPDEEYRQGPEILTGRKR